MSIVYTDGSSSPNPGPGGWGFVLVTEKYDICASGRSDFSTNNKMELQAVIEAIKYVEGDIIIHTDSLLTMNCAQKIWKRKCNLDMWKIYDRIVKDRKIKFVKVLAHSGDYYNELADKLASE